MKYLNMSQFRKDLDELTQDRVRELCRCRDELVGGLQNGSNVRDVAAYLEIDGLQGDVALLRRVQELLDAHTFDLRNTYGRHVCYIEGQEPPAVPCTHLAAKIANLIRSPRHCAVGCSATNAVVVMAKLVLATIKTFDDWLVEKYKGTELIDDVREAVVAAAVLEQVANQFHHMFGRPGFLQDVPDWFRKAFAWSYHEEAPDA